jgi:hypothetical protein
MKNGLKYCLIIVQGHRSISSQAKYNHSYLANHRLENFKAVARIIVFAF